MKKHLIVLTCSLLLGLTCVAQDNIELQNNIDKDTLSVLSSPSAADQENHEIQINDKKPTSIIDSLIVKCEYLELLNELTNLKSDVKIADLECATYGKFFALMVGLNGKKTKSVKKLLKDYIEVYNQRYDQLKTKLSTLQKTIDEFETRSPLHNHYFGKLYSQLISISLDLNGLKRSIAALENF